MFELMWLFLLFTVVVVVAMTGSRSVHRRNAIGFAYGAVLLSSLLVGIVTIAPREHLSSLAFPVALLLGLIFFVTAIAVSSWRKG